MMHIRVYGVSVLIVCCAIGTSSRLALAAEPSVSIRRITSGPKHHFFGYIGQCQTIPWNQSGRYIVALRTEFQDRMPTPQDAADVILLDTHDDYSVRVVDRTRAWNFQQGTMLYWNPRQAETQFIFNDRDPQTNRIFAVLFDISAGENGRRIREYRYDDVSIGNSGVAQKGGAFLALNYGRLARLRPVTGYPGAYDWNAQTNHPTDDGIFRVDIETGRKTLIVSYAALRDAIRPARPDVDDIGLFINHTLWNRDDDRIYFYARGRFGSRESSINIPFTVRPDGSELTLQRVYIGGHPEWEFGARIIGSHDDKQVIYDTIEQRIVDTLGTPQIFPGPGGDIALSPDGKWFVNGYRTDGRNRYAILNRSDGSYVHSRAFDQHGWTSGELRNDPAPCWNRDGSQILFPAFAANDPPSRQLFVMDVNTNDASR